MASIGRSKSRPGTRVIPLKQGEGIMRHAVKLLLVTALFLVVTVYGQDEQYKIRAKVDLVVVPVTVKGAGDKLITDLKKEDFIVLEDGQKQTITNFTIGPVPLSAAV